MIKVQPTWGLVAEPKSRSPRSSTQGLPRKEVVNRLTTTEIALAVKEGGFLLEQEVASIIEAHQFRVWTNHPYEDPEEGKERETDVVAEKIIRLGARSIHVFLICQCKKLSYPLVAISRPKDSSDTNRPPEEYHFPKHKRTHRIKENISPTFFRVGLHQGHYFYSKRNKATLLCGILRNGKKLSAKNLDHDLILTTIKPYLAERTAYSLSKKQIAEMDVGQISTHPYASNIWLFFPILLTSGPLYVLSRRSSRLQCKSTYHCTLMRKLRTAYYEGTSLVEIIHFKYLEKFLRTKLNSFVSLVQEKADQLL